MIDENLIGYLLNALDEETHSQVEAQLETEPVARERLEVLRRALDPLAADRDEAEPPPDLVVRTLGRVAEQCCSQLPRAPLMRASGALGGGTPFWRRADVLVAACLLLTALGVGIPWVLSAHDEANRVACADNLRRFHTGLQNYRALHANQFPNVATAATAPRNVAGLIVPILRDAQLLPEPVSVRCPANGDPQPCVWTMEDLKTMDAEQFQRHVHSLASCYAYSLGYRSDNAVLGPRFDPGNNASLPIMADCPPPGALRGNSRNHGGKGQNVLFQDGHVAFCSTRTVGFKGDDIYVNKEGKVASGIDWMDAVLGDSAANP
ncbi:MAG TPA: hypothetical protein VEL76_02020 [Gemmataceae bacterium]|nr:hypothetical protein [Gemmataceae bacterium]